MCWFSSLYLIGHVLFCLFVHVVDYWSLLVLCFIVSCFSGGRRLSSCFDCLELFRIADVAGAGCKIVFWFSLMHVIITCRYAYITYHHFSKCWFFQFCWLEYSHSIKKQCVFKRLGGNLYWMIFRRLNRVSLVSIWVRDNVITAWLNIVNFINADVYSLIVDSSNNVLIIVSNTFSVALLYFNWC